MKKKTRKAFMRIAMARLRKDYAYYPQRLAIAAKMFRKWLERKQFRKGATLLVSLVGSICFL
jgi:hypothetical protein